MARALLMADKQLHCLKLEVKELKPKALFADAVQTSHTSILIGELAKLLKQNGVDTGQRRLFQWMRDNGYLMKSGSSRNMPTQYSMERGLFEIKESTVSNPDGSVRVTKTPKVTGKGQIYFVNKFIKQVS
jgi:anti-repressor protein